MADSNITKMAMANSMKELMRESSFQKISIKDICDRCNMNRKSFYYHFKDKYDLVNWIFDVEFIEVFQNRLDINLEKTFYELLRYLYDNKDFYKKALMVQGQNSIDEHFREMLVPFVNERISDFSTNKELSQIYVGVMVDAFMSAIHRWLSQRPIMHYEEFFNQLALCIYNTAVRLVNKIENQE